MSLYSTSLISSTAEMGILHGVNHHRGGLAYSTEKGANVVTEAGQLVMDELIETQPEAAQFQHKGFKFWDCMNQFVPPDKARGTNTHHAGSFSMLSQSSTSVTSMLPQPPFTPPVQHYQSHQPPFAQPRTLHQLQSTQAASQFTFVQYQTETTDWTQTVPTTQNV
ncbi:hypothetical protein EDD16DRAFT_1704675 [Pisolithus croceorrhizus]|nr:hypothetical protein EDD16DRAFT_1704675 [Pisolithus croceorrhizus]